MESNLKKFNTTVHDFVKELKTLFEENDKDLENIETFYEMTKINVRAIIVPYQSYVIKNTSFVKNIMEENVDYFMEYNFDELISSDSPYSKYAKSLVTKFREVIKRYMVDNKNVVKAMFEWFKLMTFYAASDMKINVNDLLSNPADDCISMTL
jgi:hypothetical protein